MVLAIQLHLVAAGDTQPGVLTQIDAAGQHTGDRAFLAGIHEPRQLRTGADLIHTRLVLGRLCLAGAVPCGAGGGDQLDLKLVLTVLGDGDGTGGILHTRAGDDVGIGLGHGLEGAVLIDGNRIPVAVRHGDGQVLAVDGAAVAALEGQRTGDELGLSQSEGDLGQTGQDTGNRGGIKAGVCTLGIRDAAVGTHTGMAALFDGTGEGVAVAVPILGNGDLDLLTGGVAAEVIYAEVAAGIGLEEGAVLALVVQGEVEVIRTGQLLLGADQIFELQIHSVAGLQRRLGFLGQFLAVLVHQCIADSSGGDDLIIGLASLFHLDDVAAGGQAGHGHSAVPGDSHAVGGKAVEGHLVGDRGACHRDGGAALGLEAVLRALSAQIEQDVMLGIQRALLVLGDDGVHTVQGHIGLDAGAVAAHGDDEHTGTLRPYSGELFADGAALPGHVGHGVIGHQHDGGTRLIGFHGGHVAVLLVGGDGQHVAGLAVDVDDLIVHVRQRHLGVHEALDGEPVAEGVQLEGLTHSHVLVALGIDVQVNVRPVIHVIFKVIDRALVEVAIADV